MSRIVLSSWFAVALAALAIFAPRSADTAPRLVFETVEIAGEVPKPQVSVFITRQNLNDPYDLELKESFLPKIVEALDFAPF